MQLVKLQLYQRDVRQNRTKEIMRKLIFAQLILNLFTKTSSLRKPSLENTFPQSMPTVLGNKDGTIPNILICFFSSLHDKFVAQVGSMAMRVAKKQYYRCLRYDQAINNPNYLFLIILD